MSILPKEKRKKRHLPGSPPPPLILHKARWPPHPMHTNLWGIHSFCPAQNKLHIPLRKITQHLPLRRSECWYLKPKCSSKTCQIYLAEARLWSLQSVKRLSVTEWNVVVLWGVGLSLLLWKQILWWSEVVQCLIFHLDRWCFFETDAVCWLSLHVCGWARG